MFAVRIGKMFRIGFRRGVSENESWHVFISGSLFVKPVPVPVSHLPRFAAISETGVSGVVKGISGKL